MKNKLHIGYHKCGSTFLQKKIFPKVGNYAGMFYLSGKHAHHDFKRFYKENPQKTCKAIIDHYNQQENIFISCEIFSKVKHEYLFEVLDDKWDVLVVSRNLKDLLRSRSNHRAPDFFLDKKIASGIVDQEIIDFYNPKKLSSGISNLTTISFEKIFSGDKSEIDNLSSFLGHDVYNEFVKNIDKKVNKSKKK